MFHENACPGRQFSRRIDAVRQLRKGRIDSNQPSPPAASDNAKLKLGGDLTSRLFESVQSIDIDTGDAAANPVAFAVCRQSPYVLVVSLRILDKYWFVS